MSLACSCREMLRLNSALETRAQAPMLFVLHLVEVYLAVWVFGVLLAAIPTVDTNVLCSLKVQQPAYVCLFQVLKSLATIPRWCHRFLTRILGLVEWIVDHKILLRTLHI